MRPESQRHSYHGLDNRLIVFVLPQIPRYLGHTYAEQPRQRLSELVELAGEQFRHQTHPYDTTMEVV